MEENTAVEIRRARRRDRRPNAGRSTAAERQPWAVPGDAGGRDLRTDLATSAPEERPLAGVDGVSARDGTGGERSRCAVFAGEPRWGPAAPSVYDAASPSTRSHHDWAAPLNTTPRGPRLFYRR